MERLALDVPHNVVKPARRFYPNRAGAGYGGGGSEVDFTEEPLGPEHGPPLGAEQLERHRAVVLEVPGQVDGGHPTAPELLLERVPMAQAGLESF